MPPDFCGDASLQWREILAEAIDSVLAQTFDDFEFVIIDDGSSDQSLNIISNYNDPRIRCVRNEINRGITITRNKGLDHARGDYVAIIDCDDVSTPDRLEEQLRFLKRNPDFGMVGSWIEIENINQSGKSKRHIDRKIASPECIPAILLFQNYFIQSSIMLRKCAIPEDGYRALEPSEDYDMWVRIAQNWRVWNLQKVLVRYRYHPENISHQAMATQEKNCRYIIREQIRRFDLDPCEDKLTLHRSFALGQSQYSVDLLVAAEFWLRSLIEANGALKLYDDEVFRQVIAEQWWALSKKLAKRNLRLFYKSLLSKHSRSLAANISYELRRRGYIKNRN